MIGLPCGISSPFPALPPSPWPHPSAHVSHLSPGLLIRQWRGGGLCLSGIFLSETQAMERGPKTVLSATSSLGDQFNKSGHYPFGSLFSTK